MLLRCVLFIHAIVQGAYVRYVRVIVAYRLYLRLPLDALRGVYAIMYAAKTPMLVAPPLLRYCRAV